MAEGVPGPGTIEGGPPGQPTLSGPEGIKAPPGVSQSAAEVWSATWGGKNPLESVRNQLLTPEEELNPEGKDPVAVATIMQRVDTMDFETREARKGVFQQACDILKTYAHKSKLLGLDAKTILLEEDLKRNDKAKINEVEQGNPGRGAVLQELLDGLDATEEELTRVANTLGSDQYEGLFSEKGWEQLKTTRGKLQQDKANFEQGIAGMTSPGFLGDRKDAKTRIEQEKEKLEIKTRQEREKSIKEQRAEPEAWESELEGQLLKDKKIILNLDDEHTPNYEEHRYFASLPFAQVSEYVNNPDNQNAANLEQAKTVLEWHFQQAEELKIFEDLQERLDQKYQEWANSLLPHREMSQMDMLTDSQGRLTQKTFAEVEDEIIEYSNTLLDSNRPQYVEQPARWEFLQRRGLTSQDRGVLQGIRADFVRRAQAQIEDSILNLDLLLKREELTRQFRQGIITQAQYNQDLARLGPDVQLSRILGGWNVNSVERRIRERRERQTMETVAELLFREEHYYTIVLLGHTRQTIELGADQAAENIIQSATTFDIQAIQQRMEMLLKALRKKSPDLQRNERISEKDANVLIEQMEDSVTNKIDFFILDWLGQNMLMDQFSSYMEQRVRIRGVEKLRQMPAMNDGLVGIALSLLTSEQYRLYYRPQGFKGQLFDDDTTHKYLRSLLKNKLIGTLMEYELKGGSDEERSLSRENLTRVSTADQFLSNFEHREPPDIRLERIKQHYQQVSEQVKARKEQNEATFEDLARLRVARKELALEQSRYQEVERRANSAFTIAAQVMNIFGEAAELGAPSIRMDNGDYLRIDDAVLFYKYAILEAAKKYGDTNNGAQDNAALIRWRSRMWIQRWKKAGLNRANTDNKFHIELTNGKIIPIELQRGFEETGLSKEEWQALQDAVKEIREKGHIAKINGVKFEDIVKMENLKPVNNNFLADYKSSESQINNEIVLEQVAKGRLPAIRNVLRRLGLIGRQGIAGNTSQQRIDTLTQMIEDSRALHAELERLVYFEATHGLPQEGKDPRMLPFSPDRIDYGFQNESWGVKRLHHLKAFWYTNLRRTVPRAVDLVHALPFSLGSLSQEMTFDNILELALNVNTTANGMESVDNPALTMFADRHKRMVYLRTKSEGEIGEGQGGLSKVWGFLEKPLVDSNSLWKWLQGKKTGVSPQGALMEYLNFPTRFRIDKDRSVDDQGNIIGETAAEELVNHFQETTLSRFMPIVTGTEQLLGSDRQSQSSGAGFYENEKFALRFLEWLLSEKRGGEDHGVREEGGMEAFSEIQGIIRLITKTGSYKAIYRIEGNDAILDIGKSSSIWNEVWRKLIPSHNIRLPDRAPEPTYLI